MDAEQKKSASEPATSKPLRPALIVSEYTVSVYLEFLKHLLVGLVDQSIPVALVCPPDCDADSFISPSVEVFRYPAFQLPLMGHQNKKMLVNKLENFNPTILHCLCESMASLTKELARRLALPYILMVNSLQKPFGPLSVSAKRCAKIIVPAKSIAANFAAVCPWLAERIVQINIGAFVRDDCRCFSRPFQLASIITVYPFDNIHYFENLLKAVKRLVVDGHEFMMAMIGSGPAEEQLRRLLTELGLTQTVVIVPAIHPWHSALAAGDIFVQAQSGAAFNPLLLEAMSVGTVVVRCRGGVDDLIIDGETAVAFTPDNEFTIYTALRRLFDNREFARQLATNAQQYLKENHTVGKMIIETIQTYRDALA